MQYFDHIYPTYYSFLVPPIFFTISNGFHYSIFVQAYKEPHLCNSDSGVTVISKFVNLLGSIMSCVSVGSLIDW
jgi:hypothetical protein